MNVYGVTRILTLNVQDFTRYSNISPVHPATRCLNLFLFERTRSAASAVWGLRHFELRSTVAGG